MPTKRINLALQGGGTHGAFTWGVMDRILQEPDLEIAAISGTSAGALNGAAVKAGLLKGGPQEARNELNRMWSKIGSVGDFRLTHWMTDLFPNATAWASALGATPGYRLAEAATDFVSPYSFGPFYRHPLQSVVDAMDYDTICKDEGPQLFICATNVRTGTARIFTRDEITTDSLLASACLPTVFQAVEIDDPQTGRKEAYWDGGYTGNPALHPLFDQTLPDDIVIVNINPMVRDSVPKSAPEIQNRINEVSFNSALLHDLRAINFVHRLLDQGRIPKGAMKKVLVHMIADDGLMQSLGVATKTVPNPLVISELKSAGRRAAERFLSHHKDDLNERQTVDLGAIFGEPMARLD